VTSPDINVEFPQYAAKFTRIETDASIILVVTCPLCECEVMRRTYDTPIRYEMVLAARAVDRETYWSHLVKSHPDHFEESAS
jgi:hypothetical protein